MRESSDTPKMTLEEFEEFLDYQQGEIEIAGGVAQLDVPETFRFTDQEKSRFVLEELWGNPEDDTVLGMLFPADVSPADADAWGVVITYEEEGYVDDEDAESLDYDELLAEMQQDTKDGNEARREAGFEPIELVGWAEAPHYDAETKKLYWAKDLKFGDSDSNALNYNVRVLGRKGVLVLNAVASTSQLAQVDQGMASVIEFVNFNEGHRYADFNPDIDEVAAYGIGALIAGKAAAKVGLFKGLIALLLAGKKFVVIGAIALFALLRKIFTGRAGEEEAPAASDG